MGEVRVYRGSDDFAANLPELLSGIAKSDDLGGTHEREVQRIKEEDNILSCAESK